VKLISVDTSDYSCSDRLDVWQQVITTHLVPFRVLPAPEVPFRRRLCRRVLGCVDVVVTTGTSGINRRPQRMVAEIGNRRAGLSLHLAGSEWVVSEDRSQHCVRPGDLVLWDLSRPMSLAWSTSTCAASVHIPVEALVPRFEQLLTSAATILPTSAELGALIEAYLRRLTGLSGDVPSHIAAQLGRTTIDLLATYFAFLLGDTPSIDGAVQRTHLHQAKTYIEAHLGDPDLCPATVAAAQHISVRLLHKLFATECLTVASWIRNRRLERVHHNLLDPRYAHSSITAIVSRWGFTNPAHFSRLFKSTYGTSPSDYRRSSSQHAISPMQTCTPRQ
jgi:AraC-like DNA-binding protein